MMETFKQMLLTIALDFLADATIAVMCLAGLMVILITLLDKAFHALLFGGAPR